MNALVVRPGAFPMHPIASNCTTISRRSLSEEVGDFAFLYCLFCGNDRLDPKGGLGIASLKRQLCARNLWTSAQSYLAINWRGEVGSH